MQEKFIFFVRNVSRVKNFLSFISFKLKHKCSSLTTMYYLSELYNINENQTLVLIRIRLNHSLLNLYARYLRFITIILKMITIFNNLRTNVCIKNLDMLNIFHFTILSCSLGRNGYSIPFVLRSRHE